MYLSLKPWSVVRSFPCITIKVTVKEHGSWHLTEWPSICYSVAFKTSQVFQASTIIPSNGRIWANIKPWIMNERKWFKNSTLLPVTQSRTYTERNVPISFKSNVLRPEWTTICGNILITMKVVFRYTRSCEGGRNDGEERGGAAVQQTKRWFVGRGNLPPSSTLQEKNKRFPLNITVNVLRTERETNWNWHMKCESLKDSHRGETIIWVDQTLSCIFPWEFRFHF